MSQSSFPLYVDHRVGSVELAKNIRLPVEVTTLPFADFAFLGYGPNNALWNFGIERKTFPDLLGSIESGRFSGHQLSGLLNHYHVVYFLVEGEYKLVDGDIFIPSGAGRVRWIPVGGAKRQHRFSYAQYSGFINTLQVITNLKFWFTKKKNGTGGFGRTPY